MKLIWTQRWTLCLLAVAGLFLLTACPGTLENPEQFTEDQSTDSGDTGSDTAMDTGDTGDDMPTGTCNPTNIQTELFVPSCGNNAACHGTAAAGGLNLTDPDPASRMLGVMATDASCSDRTLVIAGDSANSFFYQKVLDNPDCGSRMPISPTPLSDADKQCIVDWINSL